MKIDFLIRECGKEIILFLFNNNSIQSITSIHNATNITFSHISIIIKEMFNTGLITKEKIGRKYNIFLTEKGYQVAKSLKFIEETFGGAKC